MEGKTELIELDIPNPEKVFTPVYWRIKEAKTRFVINKGGTGSSKSFSAAQNEVLISCQRYEKTLVIRKVGNTIRDSVWPSFKSRIAEFQLTEFFKLNKSEYTITNEITGSQFIFRGLDDPEKLKSIEGITRVVIEEATELDVEDLLELNRRVRGVENIQIVINFNPIHESHWLKGMFFDNPMEDCTIIHSTYMDNPFLTEDDKKQIEWLKGFRYNQYRVYGLGEWGLTENKDPWLFSFDESKHVVNDIPFLTGFPVYLSFDFNREPVSCIACQMTPSKGTKDSFIHIIQEFSADIQLEDLCKRIKAAFPFSILFVTGDASGNAGDLGFSDRHATYYKMIQAYLRLSDKQMNLIRKNSEHNDSRLLCNTILYRYPSFKISRSGCPKLINDCHIATVDEKSLTPGKLKKDREAYKMDLFDAFRYFLQTYFKEFADRVYMTKSLAA